jgi:hypothetical protein
MSNLTRQVLQECLEAMYNMAPRHYRERFRGAPNEICFDSQVDPCICTACRIRQALRQNYGPPQQSCTRQEVPSIHNM